MKVSEVDGLLSDVLYFPPDDKMIYGQQAIDYRRLRRASPQLLIGIGDYWKFQPEQKSRLPSGFTLTKTLVGPTISGRGRINTHQEDCAAEFAHQVTMPIIMKLLKDLPFNQKENLSPISTSTVPHESNLSQEIRKAVNFERNDLLFKISRYAEIAPLPVIVNDEKVFPRHLVKLNNIERTGVSTVPKGQGKISNFIYSMDGARSKLVIPQ